MFVKCMFGKFTFQLVEVAFSLTDLNTRLVWTLLHNFNIVIVPRTFQPKVRKVDSTWLIIYMVNNERIHG